MRSQKELILSQRYPILENVPLGKRKTIFRKAILHPIAIFFAFFMGLVVLPPFLEYILSYLNISDSNSDYFILVKLFFFVSIPFFITFTLFNKVLLPWCIKRVMRKQGYIE